MTSTASETKATAKANPALPMDEWLDLVKGVDVQQLLNEILHAYADRGLRHRIVCDVTFEDSVQRPITLIGVDYETSNGVFEFNGWMLNDDKRVRVWGLFYLAGNGKVKLTGPAEESWR